MAHFWINKYKWLSLEKESKGWDKTRKRTRPTYNDKHDYAGDSFEYMILESIFPHSHNQPDWLIESVYNSEGNDCAFTIEVFRNITEGRYTIEQFAEKLINIPKD